MSGSARDLTGMDFGGLRVIGREGRTAHGHVRWRCLCGCGTERVVMAQNLISGATTSCGCRKREMARTLGIARTRAYRRVKTILGRAAEVDDLDEGLDELESL